ncbi:MAG: amidase [Nocardioidaceae bacterium]
MTITTAGARDEVLDQDAVAQADLVRRGEITAEELVAGAIARIEALDPVINAVVIREFDRAVDAARRPLPDGPFTGVPFLLKDLAVEWDGVRFTEGSAFLRDNVSGHDQELTRRIQQAGLVLAGKTNTPEFGALPTCEPALFGPTRNPWDPTRTPGGSSGGAAAAVAAAMVPMAYGNDAGGSIRFPASCCGVFGLKPTRARLPFGPEYGDVFSGLAVEFALTRSVRDAAVLLDALAGPDLGDPYWAPPSGGAFAAELGADPGRLRIAFCDHTPDGTPVHPDCVAAVRDAAALCESLGHHVVERELPGVYDQPYALDAIDAGAIGWILAYWIRKLGREPDTDEIEPLTRAMWEMSRSVTAADYLLAVQDAQTLGRTIARFFTEVDLWLTPTLAQPPAPIGHITGTNDDPGQVMQRFGEFIGFPAWVANATGNPAMSVPLHWGADDLPIGVHFLARFGDEATLLRLAAQLEQARPWGSRRPALHPH